MVYVVPGNGFKTKFLEFDGPVPGYSALDPNSEGLERLGKRSYHIAEASGLREGNGLRRNH